MIAFQLLFNCPEGFSFVDRHWEDFEKLITMEGLFAIEADGTPQGMMSPFYMLCAVPEGRKLIATHWKSTFSALISEKRITNHPNGKELMALIESCPSVQNYEGIRFFSPSYSESNKPNDASNSCASAAVVM